MLRKILILLHSLISFVTFSQENWSLLDLKVTTFRNGDPLLEVTTEANWKFCNANQIPAYVKLGPSLEDGVLYNFYAVDDERQLAPEGYRIATIDDVYELDNQQFFQTSGESWKTEGMGIYFNAIANGYISFDSYNVLSKGDAGYYWTRSIGKSLQSKVIVVIDNERGYAVQEINRESFCAVRCVIKKGEEQIFNSSELEIKYNLNVKTNEVLFSEDKFTILTKEQITLNKEKIEQLLGEFVKVEGGVFQIGSTKFNNEKIHKVQLSTFYIQPIEVTQELFELVMGVNPSTDTSNNLFPVTNVSWGDCQLFISKLNVLTGKKFRLPTEAEWEYASRGGQKSRGFQYSGSNTLGEVAWFEGNSNKLLHEVKKKNPNELGIYDMSGNVWEWCLDWYGDYIITDVDNPKGPSNGTYHVNRGGSCYNIGIRCRSSYRRGSTTDYLINDLGFRLVMTY